MTRTRQPGLLHDVRATIASLPPNLVRASIVLLVLPTIGTTGYIVIEGWSFLDALYMTVTVLTTIGFREVRELDTSGRIFTMALAISGVGAIFYALISVFQFVLEGELGNILGSQRMKRQISRLEDHYILCGFGRVGTEIAREFADRQIAFVIIDTNPDAIERAARRGYPMIAGDATSDDILREAGIDRARCLLAASDSDAGNTFIVLTAKALQPSLYVVSRAADPESLPRMARAGAERVFSPYVIAGRQMALSALKPMVVEFIDTLSSGENVEGILAEIDITEGSGRAGATIQDLLTGTRGIAVLAVKRTSGELKVGAAPSTTLFAGDRVIVIGPEEDLERIRPAQSPA
ncbi:MAG: potassium channel protein [Dehalococcoidia bacterium]